MRAYVMIKMKCSRCGQRVDNGVFVDDYSKEKYAGKVSLVDRLEDGQLICICAKCWTQAAESEKAYKKILESMKPGV